MSLLDIIVQVVSAFFGVVTLAVLFRVPKKYIVLTGVTGAVGWLVQIIMTELLDNQVFVAFLAAFSVAVLSQIFARISKAPVTLYLVTGILPLVPGIGMYRTVYYLLQGNNQETSYYFSYTLQVAGMIALAIFVVDSFCRVLYKKRLEAERAAGRKQSQKEQKLHKGSTLG